MSRSHHAKSPRQRRRELFRECDEAGHPPAGLLKLEEAALKKRGAKETERWRREATKAGGLRHHTFTFTGNGWAGRMQPMRGALSDIPGAVLAPSRSPTNRHRRYGTTTLGADLRREPNPMIDRAARVSLAEKLRQLASGAIAHFRFEAASRHAPRAFGKDFYAH